MDSFPEAFERFESDVDIGQFESYHQLTLAFRYWAGEKWKGTRLQWEALNAEVENVALKRQISYEKNLKIIAGIQEDILGEGTQ